MRQRPFRECEHEHEHEYGRAANTSIHRSSAIHTELGAFGTCGAVALLGLSARASAARVPPPLREPRILSICVAHVDVRCASSRLTVRADDVSRLAAMLRRDRRKATLEHPCAGVTA